MAWTLRPVTLSADAANVYIKLGPETSAFPRGKIQQIAAGELATPEFLLTYILVEAARAGVNMNSPAAIKAWAEARQWPQWS